MKRRALAISLVLMFAVFCGTSLFACTDWEYVDWLTVEQREVIDEAMEKMCNGIKNKDAEAVKSTFAYSDMLDVPNFDESVQKLLNYVQGDDITFKFVSSGYEDAAMGTYPKERYFGGCNYEINTSERSYKVQVDYRSYYSNAQKDYFNDLVDVDMIGFLQFDIIDKNNDRHTDDKLYSGCPETKRGINFDYKTIYIYDYDIEVDSFRCEKIYCDTSANFAPVIINDATELTSFYESNKNAWTLDSRPDNRGFTDVTTKYDERFFENRSLCLIGFHNDGGGFAYVPQWLYVGDFVLTCIASLEYDPPRYGENPDYNENGVIIVVELPEKVADGIDARLILR